MTWLCMLADTITGQLDAPVDIPSFSWSMSVTDFSLTTTKSKDVGEGDASGITIPWTGIPGSTPRQRASAVCADKRSVALFWHTGRDGVNSLGTPILMGVITPRTDSWVDTSFTLDSPMGILADRYMVRDGKFADGANGTSKDSITLSNLSLRGVCSEVGYQCTDAKSGGRLPIDWQYRGESGSNSMTYKAFDVQNQSCATILRNIAAMDGGPDMTFRPYQPDPQHVRFRFVAGSDSVPELGQTIIHRLYARKYGGDLENLTVDHVGPVMRVYGVGSGSDEAQLTVLAEDMGLSTLQDPWPLRETVLADTDVDQLSVLQSRTSSMLAGNKQPLMQFKGTIHANDMDSNGSLLHPLGSFWPGELFELAVDGHPALDDGIYRCRLMRMDGDETDKVDLTFDAMENPMT